MKNFISSLATVAAVLLINVAASAQEFTHTTTAENVVASKSTINAAGLANNPQAIIVATPTAETARANPHPVGAWYYNGKWNIFNTDHATMPAGLVYKVQVFPTSGPNQFLHVVTRDNLSEAASYIDNPALNNNPNAAVTILQNYAPDNRAYNLNANHAEVRYNPTSGKWFIANLNGKSLYPNTAYNVVVGAQTITTPKLSVQIPELTIKATVSDQPPQPAATTSQPSTPATGRCTDEMARQTVGKWGRQKVDDLAMADRTFPKTGYKPVLAKAQEVIELFKIANPEFKGMEARPYRGIRGQSIIPNGPLPFRVDIGYSSYICIGDGTYKIDMRGKVILYGGYGTTTVSFNSLSDVLQSPRDGAPFLTAGGEEIREYNKNLGDLRGFPLIQTSHRDSYHEAVIIAANNRLPYRPVTREEYLRARIHEYQKSGGMDQAIASFDRVLTNMSPAERAEPALVRDISALPGGTRLFVTEAEGGRHLVTVDKSYFDPKLPRDKIQLITVHWHSSPNDPADRPKVEMVEAFKRNFDFLALGEMLGM